MRDARTPAPNLFWGVDCMGHLALKNPVALRTPCRMNLGAMPLGLPKWNAMPLLVAALAKTSAPDVAMTGPIRILLAFPNLANCAPQKTRSFFTGFLGSHHSVPI